MQIETLSKVARHFGASAADCDAALNRSVEEPVFRLADALSPSPVAEYTMSDLEIVTWLSVCQALQRLSAYLEN